MIRKFVVLLVILLMVGMLSSAFAQYEEDKPSKYGIRVVGFVPFEPALKDLKAPWIGAGADWYLKYDEDGYPTSYISIFMLSASDLSTRASIVPITYTRLNRKLISPSRSSYFGYGVGINRLEAKSGGVQNTTLTPSIHALYGQEFGNGIFIELGTELRSNWSNVNWSGWFLSIGSRISM